MRFGNCADCNEYRFLEQKGCCRSCVKNEDSDVASQNITSVSAIGGTNNTSIIGQENGGVAVFDANSESVKSQRCVCSSSRITDVYSRNDKSYLVTKDGKLVVYDHFSSKILWEEDIHSWNQTGMTVDGGKVYNTHTIPKRHSPTNRAISIIQCYSTNGRTRLWSQKINPKSKKEFAREIVSNNRRLFIGTNKGNVMIRDKVTGNHIRTLDSKWPVDVICMSVQSSDLYLGLKNNLVCRFVLNSDCVRSFSTTSLKHMPRYLDCERSLLSIVTGNHQVQEMNRKSLSTIFKKRIKNARCTKILDSKTIYGSKKGIKVESNTIP